MLGLAILKVCVGDLEGKLKKNKDLGFRDRFCLVALGNWFMLESSSVESEGKMRKSFKDSLKALEADIQFANTL